MKTVTEHNSAIAKTADEAQFAEGLKAGVACDKCGMEMILGQEGEFERAVKCPTCGFRAAMKL